MVPLRLSSRAFASNTASFGAGQMGPDQRSNSSTRSGLLRWLVVVALVSGGCSPKMGSQSAQAEAPTAGAEDTPRAAPAGSGSQPAAAPDPEEATRAPLGPADSTGDVGGGSAEASAPDGELSSPLEDGRAPEPGLALPALRVRHIGMHIGGESNTDAAKRPWLGAIERQETQLLRCYRWVDRPLAGGTLGVDLYVTRAGGSPEVRKTRQKLGGDEFDACVRQAFQRVKFPAPVRATVISYSLRYDVTGVR